MNVEHFGDAFRDKLDGVNKAKLFGLLFDKLPTYAEINGGTAVFSGVNSLFLIKNLKTNKIDDGTDSKVDFSEVKEVDKSKNVHSIRSGGLN